MSKQKIYVADPGPGDPPSGQAPAPGSRRRAAVVIPGPGEDESPRVPPRSVKKKYVVGPKGASRNAHLRPEKKPATGETLPPRPKRRSPLKTILVVVVTLILFATGYYGLVAWRTDRSVHRTGPSVASALSKAPGHTNILMVGSDTRAGGNSIVPGESKAGLADVIMVVQLRGGSARVLSIPRDTKVKLPGYGDQKVNAALPLGGPELAVRAVSQLTSLPIHRFAAIDFEGFIGVTDAVGGVELCLENAARDTMSGLNLPAGCQNVSGEQSLAFVRSRHTEYLVGGRWVTDGSGDIGRIQRQQQFLGGLMRELKTPYAMTIGAWSLGPALGAAFTTDPGFGPFDAIRAARAMVGGSDSMELVALPTVPATSRGIAFLELKQPEAQQVLQQFQSD